ncbi:putative 52 kDa repressor of the inhibitor of the protein kinase-like [Scophthalmus maximus]|uniref:Putative 52 kDa repressor of the inhibitor of the protein kinase-like n=1 Tax=Scophthalmus maximus TaxID=52904 RepID=A0A2U9B965_SCOMX|nr:putative 52 kDa repressor of the inhibitor of the protein kinase-like [Scophthalmus maximus]
MAYFLKRPNIYNHDAQSTVLKEDAIPTIFDVASQPQNGQEKRNKETTKVDETESRGRKRKRN